jgi:hypothetical protein
MQCLLSALGFVSDGFNGLSWRAGGAISARAAGIPFSIIKLLGRWESSAALFYLPGTNVDLATAQRLMGSISADSVKASGLSAFVNGGFDSSGLWQEGELNEEEFRFLQPGRNGVV